MSYLTLRPKTDAGMVMVKDPDIRSKLAPTKRRHRTSSLVTLSIEPVMTHLEEVVIKHIMEEKPGDDGMTSLVYRMGAGMSHPAPLTEGTGGYYIVVLNGTLETHVGSLGQWSLIFVAPDDAAPTLKAGPTGAEILFTVYPVRDEWMADLG